MTKIIILLLSLLITDDALAQKYAIHTGTLLDGTGSPAKTNVYVTINKDRIAAISTTRPHRLPIKEFGHDTLLPGMVDAHGHIASIGIGEEADARLVNETNRQAWVLCNAHDALASGITTLRDAGTYLWTLGMREQIAATGLRWIPAGRQLVKRSPDAHMDEMFVEFDGIDDARAQVRARKQEGSEFIKLRLTKQRPLPSLGEVRAIVEEAHRLNMKVAAHTDIPADDAVHLAIAAGVDSIEHNATLRVADTDRTFADIVQRGIIVVPGIANWLARFEPLWTDDKQIPEEPLRSKLPPILVSAMQAHAGELRQQALNMQKTGYDPQKRRLELREETLRAFKAGVVLAAGPDTGVDLMPHGRLYKDIQWFIESGISVEKAVQMATLNGARAAGIDGQAGSIAAGKIADLVLLRGDVTKNNDFRDVLLVVRAGKVVFDAKQSFVPCTISGNAQHSARESGSR